MLGCSARKTRKRPACAGLFLFLNSRSAYSAEGGSASSSGSGAAGTMVACFSPSSRTILSRLTAASRFLALQAPGPPGPPTLRARADEGIE